MLAIESGVMPVAERLNKEFILYALFTILLSMLIIEMIYLD